MDSNASGRAFSLPQSYGNDPGMQRIAIIGTGPTGLYTLAALIDGQQSLAITLDEAGDQAGVGMPYGCRMGICHTCTLTLISGAIRDLRNGAVSDQPNEQVQTCITAAQGDCVLDI